MLVCREDLMRRHVVVWILFIICSSITATPPTTAAQTLLWQTPAKWHRTFKKSEFGILAFNAEGVEFRSQKSNRCWKYVDIHTFDLSQRQLKLLTYENRPWHEPGERPFRFTLSELMPPRIAAQLTDRVGKPVQNRVPLASAAAIQEIPAHHRALLGGSNGILRFKQDGIDYVSQNRRDNRSWRWSDIQTLANPNPYEFRIMAFREIAEFDLKQPLSRPVFDKLWDLLYARDLNLSAHQANLQGIHP
jgi:hypothetical protein